MIYFKVLLFQSTVFRVFTNSHLISYCWYHEPTVPEYLTIFLCLTTEKNIICENPGALFQNISILLEPPETIVLKMVPLKLANLVHLLETKVTHDGQNLFFFCKKGFLQANFIYLLSMTILFNACITDSFLW